MCPDVDEHCGSLAQFSLADVGLAFNLPSPWLLPMLACQYGKMAEVPGGAALAGTLAFVDAYKAKAIEIKSQPGAKGAPRRAWERTFVRSHRRRATAPEFRSPRQRGQRPAGPCGPPIAAQNFPWHFAVPQRAPPAVSELGGRSALRFREFRRVSREAICCFAQARRSLPDARRRIEFKRSCSPPLRWDRCRHPCAQRRSSAASLRHQGHAGKQPTANGCLAIGDDC